MDSKARSGNLQGLGARRAAAVLLALGPDLARLLFGQLSEAEVRKVALGAKELRRGSQSAVPDALNSFVQAMERVGGDVSTTDDVLREIATEALGPEIARRAFEGIAPPIPPDEVLGPIADADAEALAMVLVREQPQTVALVLSSLSPAKAAAVMEFIPEAQHGEIVRRMATVESVAPDVLREVRQALTHELQVVVAEGMRKVDGRSAALEILRRSPAAAQAEVLKAIESEDASLAADLRTKLFTFEDLARLGDRDIQTLTKDLNTSQLTIALKGSSAEVKDKFLKNMSSRAAEMLNDDLLAMGPVKLSAVEAAQAEIAKVAVKLSEEGRITVVSPTDKML